MVNATDGTETVEKAKAYIEQEKFDFPVVFDTKSEAVNNYYVTGYPATYFVDKDGNLVTYASWEGKDRIIVLLKSDNEDSRFYETSAILNALYGGLDDDG